MSPKDYYADGVNIRYLKPQSPGYDDTEMTGLKFRCRYPSKVPKRSPFMRDFGASGWVSNILSMIHCPDNLFFRQICTLRLTLARRGRRQCPQWLRVHFVLLVGVFETLRSIDSQEVLCYMLINVSYYIGFILLFKKEHITSKQVNCGYVIFIKSNL